MLTQENISLEKFHKLIINLVKATLNFYHIQKVDEIDNANVHEEMETLEPSCSFG